MIDFATTSDQFCYNGDGVGGTDELFLLEPAAIEAGTGSIFCCNRNGCDSATTTDFATTSAAKLPPALTKASSGEVKSWNR